VGIDHPDDNDAPAVDRAPPGGFEPVREHELATDRTSDTDSEEARAEYNAWYRARVAAEYPTEWVEAVSAFQAARQEHERRYPDRERSPETQEHDGSWRSDNDLALKPERNAEVTSCYAETKEQAKIEILTAMERIEAADPERHLAGLKNWFKGEERFKEKIAAQLIAKPELTIKEALAGVPDLIRFTFAYTTERYAECVRADVERLKAEGFQLIKLKNLWTSEQYKGINSQWRMPESDLRFELQLHTLESFEGKELTHWAYERLRGSQITRTERRELEDYQRRVSDMIETPPGSVEIDEFREKDHG
jgi:hypothetical protein